MEADYSDVYTATVRNAYRMTAKDLFRLMFLQYPKPVSYLLRLRDWLVKPFGLQRGGGFTELIKEEDDEKVVFEKSDSHLDFQVRLQCNVPDNMTLCQTIRVATAVKYNNSLGRIYFFFIHPFHSLICRTLLTRAARKWEKYNSINLSEGI